jgi:hypothetical protein
MLAARPTARPTHSFFELFERATNATLAGRGLLRVLDPADELVARERGDVLPRVERGRVADEGFAKIGGEGVDDAPRYYASHSLTSE